MVAMMAEGRVGLLSVHEGVGEPEIRGKVEGTCIFNCDPVARELLVVKVMFKVMGEETMRRLELTETALRTLATGVIPSEPSAMEELVPRVTCRSTLLGEISVRHWTVTTISICMPTLISVSGVSEVMLILYCWLEFPIEIDRPASRPLYDTLIVLMSEETNSIEAGGKLIKKVSPTFNGEDVYHAIERELLAPTTKGVTEVRDKLRGCSAIVLTEQEEESTRLPIDVCVVMSTVLPGVVVGGVLILVIVKTRTLPGVTVVWNADLTSMSWPDTSQARMLFKAAPETLVQAVVV